MYIYKISSKISNQIYIGSTTIPLKQRLVVHRSSYKRHLNGKGAYISSIEVVKYGDPEIELLQELPDDTKKIDLLNTERFYIQQLNSVNKNIPGALMNNKNYHKDYYKTNKKFVKCGCGSSVSHHNNKQHLKTKMHLNYLKHLTQ